MPRVASMVSPWPAAGSDTAMVNIATAMMRWAVLTGVSSTFMFASVWVVIGNFRSISQPSALYYLTTRNCYFLWDKFRLCQCGPQLLVQALPRNDCVHNLVATGSETLCSSIAGPRKIPSRAE